MNDHKFYQFRQNNSGGSFVFDNDVAPYVFIEAVDHDDANRRAQNIGIYFDGCLTGEDCSCCGDRWSPADESDAEDTPNIDGLWHTFWTDSDGLFAIVHYMDGRKFKFKCEKEKAHELA